MMTHPSAAPAAPPYAAPGAAAASPPEPQSMAAVARNAAIIWPPALVVAALGAWMCFDSPPALNWAIWTAAASLGLVWTVRRSHGGVGLALAGVLVAACALAACTAITADRIFWPIILMGVAVLLALAMALAEGVPVDSIGIVSFLLTPMLGAFRVIREAAGRVGELASLPRAGRGVPPVLRGAVLALPVVCVLALLLSAADPVLARLRDEVFALGQDVLAVPRLVFFAMLTGLTVGAYGIALRRSPDAPLPPAAPRLTLGDTERFVVLVSVIGLFALFLGLQVSYFFGNVPAVAGSGVTYAEYARRGFGELTVAATMATMLVVWLDQHAERGQGEARARVAALALIFLVQLLLDSAYRRVSLYESAYGYTAARLYARVYMIIVSLALVALGIEIWSHVDVRRLVRRVSLLGVASVVALGSWNHEAWIARRNIDRFASTGRLDETYLVRGLSANAVPEIVRALPTLPQATADRLSLLLAQHYANPRALGGTRWYEWNLRARQARHALGASNISVRRAP